ncbi:hypothetical protein BS47DRAFT_1359902 [Hydnum rufescens UP504]|uniref:Uncharacterized protein n=1 Tax=Hydnum rufescens UP504 TaxID=1448309 RepID=A0A9P6B3H4_9AGAM|nr:hypothetical protein BS47DRAFT_1359902 [Hydnum rufescens UP504]
MAPNLFTTCSTDCINSDGWNTSEGTIYYISLTEEIAQPQAHELRGLADLYNSDKKNQELVLVPLVSQPQISIPFIKFIVELMKLIMQTPDFASNLFPSTSPGASGNGGLGWGLANSDRCEEGVKTYELRGTRHFEDADSRCIWLRHTVGESYSTPSDTTDSSVKSCPGKFCGIIHLWKLRTISHCMALSMAEVLCPSFPLVWWQMCPPNADSIIYGRDQSSISCLWFANRDVGTLYPLYYTWIPTMYSSQMPYLGYILHTLNDPVVAHDVEVEQVSDGV